MLIRIIYYYNKSALNSRTHPGSYVINIYKQEGKNVIKHFVLLITIVMPDRIIIDLNFA